MQGVFDIKKILTEIAKDGFSQEELVMLLINKPNIFNVNLIEFGVLLNEICEREKCDKFNAILKYM